mmetsp:Transcript_30574/g.63851  ORF Transcript_30574/g.63851 Transcript_30574/m.63851 type:complete len:258 (-) Transcript_30574:1553-2326(-)
MHTTLPVLHTFKLKRPQSTRLLCTTLSWQWVFLVVCIIAQVEVVTLIEFCTWTLPGHRVTSGSKSTRIGCIKTLAICAMWNLDCTTFDPWRPIPMDCVDTSQSCTHCGAMITNTSMTLGILKTGHGKLLMGPSFNSTDNLSWNQGPPARWRKRITFQWALKRWGLSLWHCLAFCLSFLWDGSFYIGKKSLSWPVSPRSYICFVLDPSSWLLVSYLFHLMKIRGGLNLSWMQVALFSRGFLPVDILPSTLLSPANFGG